MLAGIEAAEQALQEQEALLGEAGEQYAAALKLNHELNESFNELGLREVNAKARRYELIREQMKIDQEVNLVLFFLYSKAITILIPIRPFSLSLSDSKNRKCESATGRHAAAAHYQRSLRSQLCTAKKASTRVHEAQWRICK